MPIIPTTSTTSTIPTILAIETSSELASAALLYGDHVMTRESSGVQTHSQTILPMVQSLLMQAGITLNQCQAIAFGAGPGSFTGVRTACGIAQGLAFGTNLPLIPIITLAAMAQACLSAQQHHHPQRQTIDVLTILDARMHEVYWAQYRYLDRCWHTVIQPTLSPASAVMPLPDSDANNFIACGNGLDAYASIFDARSFAQNSQKNVGPHAKQIGLLARLAFLRGEIMAAHEAQPFYLRNKIALTTAERERKMQEPA